jgi:hypothetical protein
MQTTAVWSHRRRIRTYVALGATASSVATFALMGSADAAESREAIPLLADSPSLTIERDMPEAVQARLRRAQRKALAVLRAAAKQHPSRAAGCASNDFPGDLGPPAPDIAGRIFGHHVEVIVRFKRLPSSLACRPWGVIVSIRGKPTNPSAGSLPWAQTFQLKGAVGRAVIRLPLYATAPYQVIVRAGTAQGRVSKLVEQTLSCPPNGCLPGESYTPNGKLNPQAVFRIRGIDRADLETSFRDALTADLPVPFTMRAVGCSSLTTCQATFADQLFLQSPYRVRYQIEGEQLAGCWMARAKHVLDPLPYEDTYQGPTPAGCSSWLR